MKKNKSNQKKAIRRLNPNVFDREFAEDEAKIKLASIKHDIPNYSDRQLMKLINKLSEFELGV